MKRNKWKITIALQFGDFELKLYCLCCKKKYVSVALALMQRAQQPVSLAKQPNATAGSTLCHSFSLLIATLGKYHFDQTI